MIHVDRSKFTQNAVAPAVLNSLPSAPQSLTDGGRAALEPLVRMDDFRDALTSVTVLPVSKSPKVRTPLRETVALGRVLRFRGVEKQQDQTVQKLMMAEGRRDEPELP